VEQSILDKLQSLPAVSREDTLQYIHALVAQHPKQVQQSKVISRKDAFGIWWSDVWVTDDFDVSLADLQDHM
jgi:Protein of unknown function (DUF2281)